MASETDTQAGAQAGDGAAPAVVPPAPAAAGNGTIPRLGVTSGELKKRLDDQRQRTERATMKRLDDEAKKHGFGGHAEMLEWVAANKREQKKPQPQNDNRRQKNGNGDGRRAVQSNLEKEHALLVKRLDTERKARLGEERKRKDLQRQLEENEVDGALRKAAYAAGITRDDDVDFAVHKIRRELSAMSDDQLQAFDEKVWFTKLKETRPYLAGETVQPATTGTGTGAAPPAPKPAVAQGQAGQDLQVDAKKLDPKGFAELLRKRGMTPPSM